MRIRRVFGIILLSLAVLSGCGQEAGEAAIIELQESALNRPQKVTVVRGDMCVATYEDAYVGPGVEQLSFKDDGVFGEYHVRLGDVVKKGDILATPARESLEKSIESMEKEIEGIIRDYDYRKATLENSIAIVQTRLDRTYEEIDEQEYLSPEFTAACGRAGEYDEQRKKLELELKQLTETYHLELPHKQEQLNKLRRECDENNIIAPFDGTVIALAETEYGSGINKDLYYVALADTSVSYVRCKSVSNITLSRLEEVLFWKDQKEYEVEPIPMDYDYYLETRNNNEEAYSEFKILSPDDNISMGDYGKLKLVTEYRKDVLMLPETALKQSGGKYYVYKDTDGQYLQVAVKIGAKDGIHVEILEGLAEGDVVYVQE